MNSEFVRRELSTETLDVLGPEVLTPSYDREALEPAVVHLSVGGFARAHQGLYFDDLAAAGEKGWGMIGVGMRSPEMGWILKDQDGLYTIIEHGPEGGQAKVVGAMVDYLYYPEEPEKILEALASEKTRLVTMTVTGEGYETTVESDPELALHRSGEAVPVSPSGVIVHALRERRERGFKPFTVLSCDNMDDSGAAAKRAVLSYAELFDPELAAWIEGNVCFPSSMVDRITPATSPELRDEIEMIYGVPDRWPVVAEKFRQWVIEDSFCNGRPPLDKVGVQFVKDVAPFKKIKGRMLNGAHVTLGYLGVLQGLDTSADAMADPQLGVFLRRMLQEEVLPLLPEAEGMDLNQYYEDTIDRLANPQMGDQLIRLCRRGSSKVPYHLLSSLREAKAAGTPHALLTIAVASWLRFLRGTDEFGQPVVVQDAMADELIPLAVAAENDPRPLLEKRSIFGDVIEDEELVAEIEQALTSLSTYGVNDTLHAALTDKQPMKVK